MLYNVFLFVVIVIGARSYPLPVEIANAENNDAPCHCECFDGNKINMHEVNQPMDDCSCSCSPPPLTKQVPDTEICRCTCENETLVLEGLDKALSGCNCACVRGDKLGRTLYGSGGKIPVFMDGVVDSPSNAVCSSAPSSGERAELRSGRGATYKWNDELPIVVDPVLFNTNEKGIINNVIVEFTKHFKGRLRFTLYTKANAPIHHLLITRGSKIQSGCWANVGNQRAGQSMMNLDENCVYHQVVRHELIHVLGFFHEQSRPDRKKYVKIIQENIMPSQAYNYDIEKNTLTYGVPYNYRSIMHYGPTAFGIIDGDKTRTTMVSLNGEKIAPSADLTKYDFQKLFGMYPCPKDAKC